MGWLRVCRINRKVISLNTHTESEEKVKSHRKTIIAKLTCSKKSMVQRNLTLQSLVLLVN